MFDHVSIGVHDFRGGLAFYDAVFAALGHGRCVGNPEKGWAGWGPHDRCFFEIINMSGEAGPVTPLPGLGTHFCFSAATRAQVRAFHATALAHGATDRGAPGLRPEYASDYYACYVADPEGHHLEAVAYIDPDEGG